MCAYLYFTPQVDTNHVSIIFSKYWDNKYEGVNVPIKVVEWDFDDGLIWSVGEVSLKRPCCACGTTYIGDSKRSVQIYMSSGYAEAICRCCDMVHVVEFDWDQVWLCIVGKRCEQ